MPPIEDLGPVPEAEQDLELNFDENDIGNKEAEQEILEEAVVEQATEEEQHDGEEPTAMLDEAQEQKRWTKRAQQMLHTLNKELAKKKQAEFKNLSKKCNRKQAAYKFYTLLILNKEKAIKINEDDLYGKIMVEKAEKFDESF